MVTQWRKDWGNEFPFYAVQLPAFNPKDQKHAGWAIVREAILNFQKDVPNTGMAITIDVGDKNLIHPKNKRAVGKRLARQALSKTYGRDIQPGGPVYRKVEQKGNKLVVHFDDIGSGLMAKNGEPLNWFYIAGADKRFHEAQANIVGDCVEVMSPEVPKPVAVRYAWANYPEGCNLFNKEKLPASPFRSDEWPLEEE
jgi:sialate O-acetylesterase